MVYAPVRSIIPSLRLGDYLSVQAHKPCAISHLRYVSIRRQCHSCNKYSFITEKQELFLKKDTVEGKESWCLYPAST